MKNACDSCAWKKSKRIGTFCVKYGIEIYQPRIYCVAYERRTNEQIREQADGD